MKKKTNSPKMKMEDDNRMKAHKMLKSHKKRSRTKKSTGAMREMTVNKKRTKAISKHQIIKRIRI